MKKLLYNKNNHLDVRDTIGVWSLIKEAIDILFVVLGCNKFYNVPPSESPLLFWFWIFTIIKMCVDLPLSIAYVLGKWHHMRRKKNKKHGVRHGKKTRSEIPDRG